MNQLPTDFCLLFQDGFEDVATGQMFDKSNYVFAVGLPVLQEVQTYFKNSNKVR